jgi:hypothetical protein
MGGSNSSLNRQAFELVEERGPWPFVTWRVFRAADGTKHVYRSRHHRKGLLARGEAFQARFAERLLHCLWMPNQLNWWIGIIWLVLCHS